MGKVIAGGATCRFSDDGHRTARMEISVLILCNECDGERLTRTTELMAYAILRVIERKLTLDRLTNGAVFFISYNAISIFANFLIALTTSSRSIASARFH